MTQQQDMNEIQQLKKSILEAKIRLRQLGVKIH
jgi:hypothetical protein